MQPTGCPSYQHKILVIFMSDSNTKLRSKETFVFTNLQPTRMFYRFMMSPMRLDVRFEYPIDANPCVSESFARNLVMDRGIHLGRY